ncbi:lysozyme inhibitor LprI family protein [Rubritalea spongiae]|uniref:Lysozyme inhibitor LprI family protein n=1 Tax=Rubritalea spongiae TaxID=430797 RepID=A0ABW5E132_9BACT
MKVSVFSVLVLFCFNLVLSADGLAEVKLLYKAADKKLNANYQQVKKVLPEYEFAEIKKSQKEWLEHKLDTEKRLASEKGTIRYWELLEYMTASRAQYLWVRANVKPKEGVWDGLYSDGHGGSLSILTNENGTIYFEMMVVRGPTYHTGSISGNAVTNQMAARFTDKGIVEEKEGVTWINFKKAYDARTVTVEGINSSYYHGARAYFDGEYYRIGEFEPVIDGGCSQ